MAPNQRDCTIFPNIRSQTPNHTGRERERDKTNKNQPYHCLKTHPLHLRPRPPNRQRSEPIHPLERTSPRRERCPPQHRPRRRASPSQPTPHDMSRDKPPANRRAANSPPRDDHPPATQAIAQAQAADEVGAVCAEEGDWEVQYAARCAAGG